MTGTAMQTIRGLSWDHPRGHAPLVAASDAWAHARGNTRVEWTPRSLADFAAGQLGPYLGRFDLVACDHPLIGRAATEGWLTPLTGLDPTAVGASHASYHYDGRQWAAPVDAATLSLAYRPDLLPEPPRTFKDLLTLAETTGKVAVPMSPFSAVAIYATFCAETGTDPFTTDPPADDTGRHHALDRLAQLAALTTTHGSVDLLRTMATTDDLVAACWVYGYSTYSRTGAIGARLAFADPPASQPGAPPRPTLGGVGLGLLADAPARAGALDLLRHLTAEDTQRGLYATAGGQPAHTAAWDDTELDRLTLDFFSRTRVSMDNAYVRPNAPWFEHAQPTIGAAIQDFVAGRTDRRTTLDALDTLVGASA